MKCWPTTLLAVLWVGATSNALCASTNPSLSKKNLSVSSRTKGLSIKRFLKNKLRDQLIQHCGSILPSTKPLADHQNKIPFQSRENRIIALQIRIKRIEGMIRYLRAAYKGNLYNQKLMKIGYIFSNGLLSVGGYMLGNTMPEIGWLNMLFPMSLKAATEALSNKTAPIPKEKHLTLNVDQEMDTIIKRIQFQKEPGPFANVVCYLTSSHLRNARGEPCHPDHPFIRQQHTRISSLWKREKNALHDAEYHWALAPFVEFLTKHELKILRHEENFIIMLSGLLTVQAQFLKKVYETLLHDYKIIGCQQLGPYSQS